MLLVYRHAEGQKKQWEKPATTTAVSSTRINVYSGGSGAALQPREEVVEAPALHSQLPVLCSHCPGWVCYAEKSQPQSIPYISTVKSAQQILGTVMKHMLLRPGTDAGTAAGEGSEGKQVYFVSIQPCFDKKLEASRLVSFLKWVVTRLHCYTGISGLDTGLLSLGGEQRGSGPGTVYHGAVAVTRGHSGDDCE